MTFFGSQCIQYQWGMCEYVHFPNHWRLVDLKLKGVASFGLNLSLKWTKFEWHPIMLWLTQLIWRKRIVGKFLCVLVWSCSFVKNEIIIEIYRFISYWWKYIQSKLYDPQEHRYLIFYGLHLIVLTFHWKW